MKGKRKRKRKAKDGLPEQVAALRGHVSQMRGSMAEMEHRIERINASPGSLVWVRERLDGMDSRIASAILAPGGKQDILRRVAALEEWLQPLAHGLKPVSFDENRGVKLLKATVERLTGEVRDLKEMLRTVNARRDLLEDQVERLKKKSAGA